jgi:hypothetical protein
MSATTLYKSKIGAHLSYPCTLSELERRLSPASQRHDLEVSFPSSRASRKNEPREDYQLLEARYSSRYSGERAGEWHYQIAVYPVPRTLRAHIRGLLLPVGTDRVRDWVLAQRAPIWYTRPHRFSVHFDSVSDELSFREYPKA